MSTRSGARGKRVVIDRLAIAGYRSLREVKLKLGPLTVVTGPNGSGKSSLYRALRLLAEVADDRVIGSLAREGGLQSVLWAGPERIGSSVSRGDYRVEGTRRSAPVGLKLGFSGPDLGYAIDLGLPIPDRTAFGLDPEIKAEAVWAGGKLSPRTILAARNGPLLRIRDDAGAWRQVSTSMEPSESMLVLGSGAAEGAELMALRDILRGWRFYDELRTDRDAPARQPRVGTRTPSLANDGGDLAAAVQTILEIGDPALFQATVEDAFPGAEVSVARREALFTLEMRQSGLLRPLGAGELSDGTLRFLLLATALLSPRPPQLTVLNEPETSLNPSLLQPLARLILRVAERRQVLVVSHAGALTDALGHSGVSVRLEKQLGETRPDGEKPDWAWPSR